MKAGVLPWAKVLQCSLAFGSNLSPSKGSKPRSGAWKIILTADSVLCLNKGYNFHYQILKETLLYYIVLQTL